MYLTISKVSTGFVSVYVKITFLYSQLFQLFFLLFPYWLKSCWLYKNIRCSAAGLGAGNARQADLYKDNAKKLYKDIMESSAVK